MNQLCVASGGPLTGHVRVPGDKSISHRAVLLGAIAAGTSRVEGFLPAADCLATLHAVRVLGVEVEELAPANLRIHGRGLHGLREPDDVLHCGRSGTTMRLLAGILAGQSFLSVLTGDAQLRRRPMGRIAEPLRRMGATVLGRDGGRRPPLAFQGSDLHDSHPHGRHLRGIDFELPVASAQVKSALLLAGLYAKGATTLHVPGPARDHTERMLAAMGGRLDSRDPGTGELGSGPGAQSMRLEPVERLEALDLVVPGDISSAAFLVVAATLVPGSEIVVEGVGVNPTRTGSLDALLAMGADIVYQNEREVSGEPVADLAVRFSQLRGVEIGGGLVVRAIDEFPVLAVAATQAQGETVVRDAAELRVKETDRIATTVEELRRLGADIEARPDGFVVRGPTPLRSPGADRSSAVQGPHGAVDSHGDHRLAMALVVAGLLTRGETLVHNTDCIDDSFPGFETALAQLGRHIS